MCPYFRLLMACMLLAAATSAAHAAEEKPSGTKADDGEIPGDPTPERLKKLLAAKCSVYYRHQTLEQGFEAQRRFLEYTIIVDPALLRGKQDYEINCDPKSVAGCLKETVKLADASIWHIDGALWVSRNWPDDDLKFKPGGMPEITAEEKAKVEAALHDMDDAAFEKREAAKEAIRAIGPAALPVIDQAAAAAEDDALELRCQLTVLRKDLVAALKRGVLTAAAEKKLAKIFHMDLSDTDLRGAVATLNASMGAAVQIVFPDEAAKTPIHVKFNQISFGDAIRQIARLSGLHVFYGAEKIILVRLHPKKPE